MFRGRSAAMIESEMQAKQDRLDKLNKAALKPPNPILVLLDTFVQDQIVPWIREVVFEVQSCIVFFFVYDSIVACIAKINFLYFIVRRRGSR